MPGQNCQAGGDPSLGCGGLGASLFPVLSTMNSSEVPFGNPTLVFPPTVSLKQSWPHGCCYTMDDPNSPPAGLAAPNGLLSSCLLTAHFRSISETSLVSVARKALWKRDYKCKLPEPHIWVKVNQMYFQCKFTGIGEQCKNWYWYLNRWFWYYEDKWLTKLFVSL